MLQVHLAVEGFDSSLTIRFLGIEGQITIIILLLFCQCVSPNPDPAMASRKQDEKRRYRLEFQIHTVVYAIE
jgi:hypothetical protein